MSHVCWNKSLGIHCSMSLSRLPVTLLLILKCCSSIKLLKNILHGLQPASLSSSMQDAPGWGQMKFIVCIQCDHKLSLHRCDIMNTVMIEGHEVLPTASSR